MRLGRVKHMHQWNSVDLCRIYTHTHTHTHIEFTSSCVPVCLSALMFSIHSLKFTPEPLPAILTLKCHLGNTKAILGSSSLNSGHTL